MNSISSLIVSMFYKLLFNLRLNKILRNHRQDGKEIFELSDKTSSFWIECDEHYASLPKEIDEYKEFNGSLNEQTELIMKNWQYINHSTRKDFQSLLKYVVWLRRNKSIRKPQYIHQNHVSDHIYEM